MKWKNVLLFITTSLFILIAFSQDKPTKKEKQERPVDKFVSQVDSIKSENKKMMARLDSISETKR